jgi:hypothetical protein
VRGEGGRGKRGPNPPDCGLGWGRSGPRRLGSGTEPVAGAGAGGGALVRKRARESAVQIRCEVEKVVGGLVWAMWGRSGTSTHGW